MMSVSEQSESLMFINVYRGESFPLTAAGLQALPKAGTFARVHSNHQPTLSQQETTQ